MMRLMFQSAAFNSYCHMHPFVKISLFIVSLVLTSIADGLCLTAMLAVMLLLVVMMKQKSYLRILLRMRWLLLSVLIIYAFGTPGELIPWFPMRFAPSYEGVSLGFMQLERLLVALTALNLLVTASPREEMMLGLYCLLLPFKYLGFNVERFTARLMLTLHYVEALAESGRQGLSFDALDSAHEFKPESASGAVHIQHRSFNLLDQSVLVMMAALIFIVIYWHMS